MNREAFLNVFLDEPKVAWTGVLDVAYMLWADTLRVVDRFARFLG